MIGCTATVLEGFTREASFQVCREFNEQLQCGSVSLWNVWKPRTLGRVKRLSITMIALLPQNHIFG